MTLSFIWRTFKRGPLTISSAVMFSRIILRRHLCFDQASRRLRVTGDLPVLILGAKRFGTAIDSGHDIYAAIHPDVKICPPKLGASGRRQRLNFGPGGHEAGYSDFEPAGRQRCASQVAFHDVSLHCVLWFPWLILMDIVSLISAFHDREGIFLPITKRLSFCLPPTEVRTQDCMQKQNNG